MHEHERRRPSAASRLFAPVAAALAVVPFFVLMVVLALVAPAGAQDPLDCTAPVVDTSGQVEVEAVEAAVALVEPELNVVVRAYDTVPDGDLVATVNELVAACFGDPDRGVQPDVVVLAVSVGDRLSDVLVGSRWGAAIPDPEAIRTDAMGSRFVDGDYTGGLIAAIGEVDGLVRRQLESAGTPTAPVEEPATAPEPTGGGQSPWALGGGLAVLAGGGGVFYLVNRHRKLVSARQEFSNASAGPLSRLGVLRERHGRLAAQSEVWAKTSAGRTLESLRVLSRECERARAETDRANGLLVQTIPDGVATAARTDIERAKGRLIELSRALDVQDESLDRLTAFGAHIDHLRVALPAKVDLIDEEVDEALEMADQRESEGWAIDGQRNDLVRIGDDMDAIDFAPLELDVLTLSDRIEAAEGQLFATDHYLQSLPSRVNSLKQWSAGLEAAADLELQRIDDARRQFSALTAVHASDSWQWAADLPEQALDELQRSDELQDVAISEMISQQRFDDAGRQLDAAGLALIAADHLLDQVDDLVVDLERARVEAPSIVAQCRDVHAAFAQYVEAKRGDLDEAVVAGPARLATAIAGLEQELRQLKPNYLRVAETGDRINRQIDELLQTAKDQHAKAEARRRELVREIAAANRAIARARRAIGWELFKSTDGHALDDLEASLRRLPEEIEAAIEAAGDVADDALRIQERIIARRRRRSVWVSTGGGGWSSGGGGWSSSSSRRSSGGGFRSSGGRSFGGRSSGGRSFGGGRSSGSF